MNDCYSTYLNPPWMDGWKDGWMFIYVPYRLWDLELLGMQGRTKLSN